jgi:hypothetical protein
MNVYISILIILVCLFFIVSATTAYVEKDKGFTLSGFQTYRWVETKSSENDPSQRSTLAADWRIHHSVEKELSKWGWRLADDHPDVLVSYDVLVNKIREREEELNAAYTESFTRFYYNEFSERWSPINYPSQFVGYDVYELHTEKSPQAPIEKATITITLLEAQTDKKIWQGWTTERLREKKLTEKEIDRSVNAIFRCN